MSCAFAQKALDLSVRTWSGSSLQTPSRSLSGAVCLSHERRCICNECRGDGPQAEMVNN